MTAQHNFLPIFIGILFTLAGCGKPPAGGGGPPEGDFPSNVVGAPVTVEPLRESVQLVQSAAAGTRIKAIDTGLTYQFRYEPNGRRFAVIPFDPPENIDSTATASAADPGQSEYPVLSGEIDESCRFVSPEDGFLSSAVVERLPREAFANLPDAYNLSTTAWAPPILFYSDGTAVDATFRLVDEGRRSIELSVRGLTGTVAADKLEREWTP